MRATRSHIHGGLARPAKITLYIPPSRLGNKGKIHAVVEPLKGSDAPGDKAAIHHILARSEPIRIIYGRRSTWVEEFLIRWEHEMCTFGDAREQYRLGFDIVSITSLEDNIPSLALSKPLHLRKTH